MISHKYYKNFLLHNSKHWGILHHLLPTKIGGLVHNLTMGGMGKCKKYLQDLSQPVTDIGGLNVMKICQILPIYLTANKNYGKKIVITE